ncbi:hypothetical protein CERSUDRAFT_63290 [Gelatoporia subvermispora B]|uniref:Uncharacterized protein n=1 Tax=Ceriporiopsis subvermispora (strain B) TaxID=914234 RepID=M2PSN8_CERS8|nr:hypothetical protein CERSUDRAFT_63290 [Gelatoporia subvermispora B]
MPTPLGPRDKIGGGADALSVGAAADAESEADALLELVTESVGAESVADALAELASVGATEGVEDGGGPNKVMEPIPMPLGPRDKIGGGADALSVGAGALAELLADALPEPVADTLLESVGTLALAESLADPLLESVTDALAEVAEDAAELLAGALDDGGGPRMVIGPRPMPLGPRERIGGGVGSALETDAEALSVAEAEELSLLEDAGVSLLALADAEPEEEARAEDAPEAEEGEAESEAEDEAREDEAEADPEAAEEDALAETDAEDDAAELGALGLGTGPRTVELAGTSAVVPGPFGLGGSRPFTMPLSTSPVPFRTSPVPSVAKAH